MSKVVVVLSGGMDSATLLAKMVDDGHEVAALVVDYGQRHVREVSSAIMLCQHFGVEVTIVDLSSLKDVMRGSSQTDNDIAVPLGHYEEESMKATVVPNRNMLLLATATAHAISLGYDSVAYGAHAGDHAIYPDCREAFVSAMATVMLVCDYEPITLMVPFIDVDKGDIADLGVKLGVPFELTWTCYQGGDVHCGLCGACQERLEAFAKNGHVDPVGYMPLAEALVNGDRT